MKDFALNFLKPLLVNFFLLISICTLYTNNFILTIIISSIFFILLFINYSHFKLLLAIIAIFFGTLGEVICCFEGIELWRYKYQIFWRIPAWLPIVWPILMITFTEIAGFIHKFLTDNFKKESLLFITDFLIVLILINSFYTFLYIQWRVTLVLSVFLILMLLFARDPYSIILFWVASICGSFGEYVCIKYNVWYYTQPFFTATGLPLSLPLAWGLSAAIIRIQTTAIRSSIP